MSNAELIGVLSYELIAETRANPHAAATLVTMSNGSHGVDSSIPTALASGNTTTEKAAISACWIELQKRWERNASSRVYSRRRYSELRALVVAAGVAG